MGMIASYRHTSAAPLLFPMTPVVDSYYCVVVEQRYVMQDIVALGKCWYWCRSQNYLFQSNKQFEKVTNFYLNNDNKQFAHQKQSWLESVLSKFCEIKI